MKLKTFHFNLLMLGIYSVILLFISLLTAFLGDIDAVTLGGLIGSGVLDYF